MRNILIKSTTALSISVLGLSFINQNLTSVNAATVKNDRQVYTVHKATKVYNKYFHGKKTGQILKANSSWKVIKTAYDKKDNKWYDLGKNQWVKAEKEVPISNPSQVIVPTTQHNDYSAQANNHATTTSNYSSNMTGSESSAKSFIAARESGGSYSARNGSLVGKYQLSASYLNGDYSASNQEKAADNYVHNRYGSWTAAKNFWQQNGWY